MSPEPLPWSWELVVIDPWSCTVVVSVSSTIPWDPCPIIWWSWFIFSTPAATKGWDKYIEPCFLSNSSSSTARHRSRHFLSRKTFAGWKKSALIHAYICIFRNENKQESKIAQGGEWKVSRPRLSLSLMQGNGIRMSWCTAQYSFKHFTYKITELGLSGKLKAPLNASVYRPMATNQHP